MLYVTVAKEEVELVSKSLMAVVFMICGVVNPVTDPTGKHEAVHVKLPPDTSEINVALKVVPEHIGVGALLVR